MPGTTAGVYPGALDAGTEVSSTYEGRHLTVREDELIHPVHALDTFVNKGDPVILCDAGEPGTYGIAVGVAFNDGAAVDDLIAIDTEGIWNLPIYAEDDDGDRAIEIGDQLYIRAGTLTGLATLDGLGNAEISKISNSVIQIPFGYALGSLGAGGKGVIAVKVHFDQKMVGNIANKGIDHVQGTPTNPIAWGTTDDHLKSMVFTVGDSGGYIDGIRVHCLTADDLTGGVYNIYARSEIRHDVQNMIGIHALSYVNPPDPTALTINQILAVSGQVYINNPGETITMADQVTAIRATCDQDATSVLTGTLIGVGVYMDGVLANNTGRTRGVDIHMGGGAPSYPDYGIYITMETTNCLAGIKIEQLAVAGGYGIDFEDMGGFYFDALMRYDGVNAHGYFLEITPAAGVEDSAIILDEVNTVGTPADYRLRVRLVGNATDRYIHLFPL